MKSQKELVQQILESLEQLDANDEAVGSLASYLYIVDKKLPEYLDHLREFTQSERITPVNRQKGGKLLEQIAYLVFRGLRGFESIKSFQSAGPQYDLVINGDDSAWLTVCKILYLKTEARSIVIEAKATQATLPDKQFSRLCHIMNLSLQSSGLGIFFTLNGATGFPRGTTSRQRKISDSRLCQVLFYAKTGKSIIVLDKDDILGLGENGSLIRMITRKIRDISELSGLPTTSPGQPIATDLPHHLKQLYEDSNL
jgi:hypothetical protein